MEIKNAYYHRQMPTQIVVEMVDGSLWQTSLTPARIVTKEELTPYRGYNPAACCNPIPQSEWKGLYGFIKAYVIEATQRTATGQTPEAETTMYIARFLPMGGLVVTDKPNAEFQYIPDSSYEIMAIVKIRHPEIMSGTWGEILASFRRMAVNEVKKDGHVVENNYGAEFWEG